MNLPFVVGAFDKNPTRAKYHPMIPPTNPPEIPRWMKVTKEGLEIFQKLALIVLFIVILFDHQRVTNWARKSPFQAIIGAEFKETEELEKQQTNNQQTTQTIDKTREYLKDFLAVQKITSESEREKLENVIENLENTEVTILETIKNLERKIPETFDSTENGWLVVFGADKTIAAAQDEINRANQKNYENAIIVKRDGWYRSVIRFDNKNEAQNQLENIQNQLRKGSYIRNLNTWCPDWAPSVRTEGEYKYYQCKD